MIELHYVHTPNVWKTTIMLEEVGLPFTRVDYLVREGEHQRPEFRSLNPNNKLPVIRDLDPQDGGEPLTVFESGAILLYLAEKTGKLLPADPRLRSQAIQWVFWQVAGLGPMTGQMAHFLVYAPQPQLPYPLERYTREVTRLLNVLDYRLSQAEYLAGTYSIADIASLPFAAMIGHLGINMEGFSNVRRWQDALMARPAVQRGFNVQDVPEKVVANSPQMSEKEWSTLFGDKLLEASTLTPQ